jgi:hypothetical protein
MEVVTGVNAYKTMKLSLRIFRFAFGCRHRRLSRVFTIKKRTYQICFECGQEVEYSWIMMHSLPSCDSHNTDVPLTAINVGVPLV